ncbi:MAG: hypothetical protein K2N44_09065 [Lachnospiraceae bacterium]|nr:hypothetical protein [Lachnospiraceae bacterium]MDE7416436.1 hypothetical protein [Lachnospiraceae bacterium]
MPSNAEIAKETIEQFIKIQDYMILAKEENATKTYDKLKKEYLSLKALLNVIGVNLIDIDIMKE